MKAIQLIRTEDGLPAYWQLESKSEDCVQSVVICGSQGEPVLPIRFEKTAHSFATERALTVVDVGYYIISVVMCQEKFSITVYKISKIYDEVAEVETIALFLQNKWDNPPPRYLEDMIGVALEKVFRCYYKI